jgi:hypothetical protein
MTHELEPRHEPHTVFQVASCSGKEHAMHREMTGKVLFYCNCGYSSGWVDKDTLEEPADFIQAHLPPGVTWPSEVYG